jgi:hypothetical protein
MTKGNWRYARFYCEENIWFLGQETVFAKFLKKVVFISNHPRRCVLFHQRGANSPELPITFDYHVILICDDGGWQAWDLDSSLSLPTPLKEYLDMTFGKQTPNPGELMPYFRIIDFEEFRSKFSSDRSHMRDSNGKWIAPPPAWPAIVMGESSNLADLIDMRRRSFGSVMNLRDFRTEYGHGGGSVNRDADPGRQHFTD